MMASGNLAYAKIGVWIVTLYRNCDGDFKWNNMGRHSDKGGRYVSEEEAIEAMIKDGGKLISEKQALRLYNKNP